MSGAEVLGILGVLPLLITAIEHYEDTLRPFVKYRNFSSKVQRIHDELEVQRTIFRSECLLLLAAAINRDTATAMLSDTQHPAWSNAGLNKRFGHQLGSLGHSCEVVISKLDGKLLEISKKAGELSAVSSQPAEKETVGDRRWRHRVGKKLKFALSDLGIRRSIDELKELTTTFLTLSSQVVRFETEWSDIPDTRKEDKRLKNTSHMISKFRTVQEASNSLYESLRRACSIHTYHVACFSLDTPGFTAGPVDGGCEVRFKLAYRHVESDRCFDDGTESSERDVGPSKISPATTTTERERDTPSSITTVIIDTIQHSLEDSQSYGPAFQINAQKATTPAEALAWFEVESSLLDSTPGTFGISHPPGPSSFVNRTEQTEFCAHQENLPKNDTCTCVLGQTASCKHIVRHPSAPLSPWSQKEVVSLAASVAASVRPGLQKEMAQFQRLSIARTLALAVLQFHSTPWLTDSWHSSGVYLFGSHKRTADGTPSTCSPFLHVSMTSGYVSDQDENASHPARSMAHIAPNFSLFRLGVMLLELAYSSTFEILRTSYLFDSMILPLQESAADFVRARLLAENVGTSLGADFATIVKKCLRCDFGCGEDLNDPTLQTRLYEDVVCKLEHLEEGFRRLQSPAEAESTW